MRFMSDRETTPTFAKLVRDITDRELHPEAFQALWDGDTEGWGLCFDVVHRAGASPSAHLATTTLAFLRFGGDVRLFTGGVPPWPEARLATGVGEALALHYGVPFHFPSPKEPDDDCPTWFEQDSAVRWKDCDKQYLARPRT